MRDRLTLVLLETGAAELTDEGNAAGPVTLWSSDSDELFWDQWDGEFLTEEDEDDIWDYLVDEGVCTEAEAECAALEVEEYTERELPELEPIDSPEEDADYLEGDD